MMEYRESFLLVVMVLVPALFAAAVLFVPENRKWAKETLLISGAGATLILSLFLWNQPLSFETAWAGFDMDFAMKTTALGTTVLFSAAALVMLLAVYMAASTKGKPYSKLMIAGVLFTQALANGALLADSLVTMLFFWEAIWAPLFVMMMAGSKDGYKTSFRAVATVGLGDLCLMLGIGFASHAAHSMAFEHIELAATVEGTLGFVLLAVGALAKAGTIPFHGWILKASDEAPAPFMALMPGSLNALLGMYFLARLFTDLKGPAASAFAGFLVLLVGAVTLVFASVMALKKKDYKQVVACLAIAQAGALILGINPNETAGAFSFALPACAAAVFSLFLIGGILEKQVGTTNLDKLSGLQKAMPVTAAIFLAAASSLSVAVSATISAGLAGRANHMGFFGFILYVAALAGAILTVASVLRLYAHLFTGKPSWDHTKIQEAPKAITWPALIAAAFSAVLTALSFGDNLYSALIALCGAAVVILFAVLNHHTGTRKTGSALHAQDRLLTLTPVNSLSAWLEKTQADPYMLTGTCIKWYARVSLKVNDGISYFYDVLVVRAIEGLSGLVKKAHNGSQSRYAVWVLAGAVITAVIFLLS